MNRSRLESTATYLTIALLGVLLVLSVVAIADGMYEWDLLPPGLDKVATLALLMLGFVTAACAMASVVLNLGIIAQRLTEIARRDGSTGGEV
jgi:hypothetical protein